MASHTSPPPPLDLSHHLNAVTLARKPNALKELYKYFMVPGMANLAAGMPNPDYFPYDTLESDVATSDRLLESLGASKLHGSSIFSRFSGASQPEHVAVPKFETERPAPERVDVATTLQYGRATGLMPLAEFVKDFALNHLHQGRIPYSDPDILFTCGATDGWSKVVGLIGTRGDNLLVEEFSYPNAISTAAPYGIDVAIVKMDSSGMMVDGPGGLKDVLENWDPELQGRKPHFMYTVSIGHNPTGVTVELPRRKQIYAVCQEHDIIIVEDDPYWHLQFTESSHANGEFLPSLTPSYLTIDIDGRVIRLDTFSKTIAPGCRLGWITASSPIIQHLIAATEGSTQQPSGFVQALIASLVVRRWGMSGWISWLSSLRDAYEKRMRTMCEILSEHTHHISTVSSATTVLVRKRRMLEFDVPGGGMFVWVRICIENHPAYSAFVHQRGHSRGAMVRKMWEFVAATQLALPSPGGVFAPWEQDRYGGKAGEYMRFCFAAESEKVVREATKRFCDGANAFWELSVEEVEAVGATGAVVERGLGEMGLLGFGC